MDRRQARRIDLQATVDEVLGCRTCFDADNLTIQLLFRLNAALGMNDVDIRAVIIDSGEIDDLCPRLGWSNGTDPEVETSLPVASRHGCPFRGFETYIRAQPFADFIGDIDVKADKDVVSSRKPCGGQPTLVATTISFLSMTRSSVEPAIADCRI